MTRILMNHIHMMALIPTFDKNFLTRGNKNFMNILASLTGLFTGSAIECMFDYEEMFPLATKRGLFFMSTPIIVFIAVGAVFLPMHFFQDHKKAYYGSFTTKIIALFVTVIAMLYPMLTLETLKMLPCRTIGSYQDSSCPRKFMMVDYDIECWRDLRHSHAYWGVAIPMLFMYVLGIPAFVLSAVLYHRDKLDEKKTHVRLNSVMAGFKMNRKWWCVVVMLRKALFISAGLFLKDYGSMIQIFGGVMVIAIFTYLHFVSDPYINIMSGRDANTGAYTNDKLSDILHKMEGSSLMVEMLTLYVMLLFTDAKIGSSYEVKQVVGVCMFLLNNAHLCWMIICLIMRGHREKKFGKKANNLIEKTIRKADQAYSRWIRINMCKSLKKWTFHLMALAVGKTKRRIRTGHAEDSTKVAPIKVSDSTTEPTKKRMNLLGEATNDGKVTTLVISNASLIVSFDPGDYLKVNGNIVKIIHVSKRSLPNLKGCEICYNGTDEGMVPISIPTKIEIMKLKSTLIPEPNRGPVPEPQSNFKLDSRSELDSQSDPESKSKMESDSKMKSESKSRTEMVDYETKSKVESLPELTVESTSDIKPETEPKVESESTNRVEWDGVRAGSALCDVPNTTTITLSNHNFQVGDFVVIDGNIKEITAVNSENSTFSVSGNQAGEVNIRKPNASEISLGKRRQEMELAKSTQKVKEQTLNSTKTSEDIVDEVEEDDGEWF